MTSTTQPEHPAVAAAVAFWDRYLDLVGRTGPFDPVATRAELDEFTTGAETKKLFEAIQGNMLTGRTIRGTEEHAARLETADGTTAAVVDCIGDRTRVYEADGTRVDTDDGLRHPTTLTLQLIDGVWKVATVSIGEDTCEP